MKWPPVAFCLTLLIAAMAIPLHSQSVQTQATVEHTPPPILVLAREEVKPGKAAAHEKLETVWSQAYAKANWPTYTLALTALTGGSEVWFCSGYPNYEAMQMENEGLHEHPSLIAETDRYAAQEDEFLSNTRRWILNYREDLSYQPDVNVGGFHNWMVDVVYVRSGHGSGFAETRELINGAHQRANMDEHLLVYQVVSGGPLEAFVIFQPIPDIKFVDTMAATHGNGSDYDKELGEDGRRRAAEFMMNDVENFERYLFATSPSMSYMSKDVMAADPAFWGSKDIMVVKSTDTKPAKPKSR